MTIEMTRGDNADFLVTLTQRIGTEKVAIPITDGSLICFTVKRNEHAAVLLQKRITEFDDGKAWIRLRPEDTKPLAFGGYLYDIEYVAPDGRVTTIITASPFILGREITDE